MNCDGKRIRGPLGTRSSDVARRLVHRLELAIADGPTCTDWLDLKTLLPASTYKLFADFAGVKPRQIPTWADLTAGYRTFRGQKIKTGELAQSTSARYEVTIAQFSEFLKEENITLLQDITKAVIERFKVWRLDVITKKRFSRGGTGLVLDVAILHRVFWYAVDAEMIVKNPVKMLGTPGKRRRKPGESDDAIVLKHGAQPFDGEELGRLRNAAKDDLLIFQLLRWTGLRGGDAVALTWQEVHFDRKEIERVTQKRHKTVIVPLSVELLFGLEAEYERRKPLPTDRVLLNPATGRPMTRPCLYRRMLALGKRAGVLGAHPHRYRDTLAVDMLARKASIYDIAKTLGDTVAVVEEHYAEYTKELRERVRELLNSDKGLEKPVTTPSQSHTLIH